MMVLVPHKIENIEEKGGNAGYQHLFCVFPTILSNPFFYGWLKVGRVDCIFIVLFLSATCQSSWFGRKH